MLKLYIALHLHIDSELRHPPPPPFFRRGRLQKHILLDNTFSEERVSGRSMGVGWYPYAIIINIVPHQSVKLMTSTIFQPFIRYF